MLCQLCAFGFRLNPLVEADVYRIRIFMNVATLFLTCFCRILRFCTGFEKNVVRRDTSRASASVNCFNRTISTYLQTRLSTRTPLFLLNPCLPCKQHPQCPAQIQFQEPCRTLRAQRQLRPIENTKNTLAIDTLPQNRCAWLTLSKFQSICTLAAVTTNAWPTCTRLQSESNMCADTRSLRFTERHNTKSAKLFNFLVRASAPHPYMATLLTGPRR